MLRVGETVGPYEILARLKSGGMATLFVGRKRGAAGFARHVAVKVVHEHLASDDEFVKMFVDEALLQARIHHPNVVHVEELGEAVVDAQTTHYLVMEYVYGCSLAQLLDTLARRDRRLSPELAVHVAIQTLAGLHAAHELKDEHGTNLGVVHRDVSPQNVLLAYEGHVKLIDFGVAKARNRSQQTTGASLKGKIRYMPPEQAMGASAIDRRADVYALGIVLWEMLAFRKLFPAKDDLALLEMVRNPKVVPPSQLSPGIPPEIDRVVMKALAPRAEDRWATAQDFRRALAEAMPKAMLVDASHVADLLGAVMSEQMQKDREALPSQLSAVVANEARRADPVQGAEAVENMTVSGAGRAYLADVPIEVEAPVSTPAPLAPPPTTPIVDAMGTPTRAPESPPSGGSGARWALALGAIAIVLVGIAAGAWYVLSEQPQTVATSLAPDGASETVGTAPPVTVAAVPTTPPAETVVAVAAEPVVAEPVAAEPVAVAPETTHPIAEPTPEPARATAEPRTTAEPEPRPSAAPPATSARSGRPRGDRRTAPAGSAVPLADEW